MNRRKDTLWTGYRGDRVTAYTALHARLPHRL
jgi:hypothetical protein